MKEPFESTSTITPLLTGAAKKIRVALLTNIPSPYRLEFFKELGFRCDLNVIFDAKTEPNRNWRVPVDLEFPHTYLRGLVIPHTRRRRDGGPSDTRYWQIRPGIVPTLVKLRPDVVISNEFGPRSIQAAVYCALSGTPFILWSEGTPHSEGWQSGLRQTIRRILVKRAHRFWSNGVEASRLLMSYGAGAETIHEGMIGVSTARLSEDVGAQLPYRDAVRAELGVQGVVFLFSGQMVPRKGVHELLSTLALLADRAGDFAVVFLGDGPLKSTVDEWSREHPQLRIVTVGFLQPERVPQLYAAADIFVMATLDDNWSLVALEAAVAGLPQVFSRYNGATEDLLRMRATGMVVDPKDTASFAAAFRQLLDARPPRLSRDTARALIDYYGPAACADRALASFRLAIKTENK